MRRARKKTTKRNRSNQRKHTRKKKAIRGRKPRPIENAPRNAEEYFAKPRKYRDQWDLAVQVPAKLRSGLPFHRACEEIGIDPSTVLKLIPSALKRKGRTYQVNPHDRLLRVLVRPSKKGLRELATRDSREASIVGEYWNAVERAIRPRGDTSALRKLRRKRVTDASGKRVQLLTNLEELKRLASAGNLQFESMYGRRA